MLLGVIGVPKLRGGGRANLNRGVVGGVGVPVPVLSGVPLLVIDSRASSKRWRYFNRENLTRVGVFLNGLDADVDARNEAVSAVGARLISLEGPEDIGGMQ